MTESTPLELALLTVPTCFSLSQARLKNGMHKLSNVIYTDFVEGARGVDLALWYMFPGAAQQALSHPMSAPAVTGR